MSRIPYTPAGRQIPAQPALQLFRVSADWPGGGGWSRTLPFADETAARAWALEKVRGRPGAVIDAQPRGPVPVPPPFREDDFEPLPAVDHTLAAGFAGESDDLVLFQGFIGGLPA